MLKLYETKYGRFLLRDNDNLSREVMAGWFWDEFYRPYFDRLGPDSVAVDVGAYIGFYSVYMAQRCKRVIAFEPQRAIFYALCGNLALNSAWNVQAHNLAVYERPCRMAIGPLQHVGVGTDLDHDMNVPGLAFLPVANGPICAAKLDDLIAERVDLLKIDCQGSDLAALRGAERLIQEWRPVILLEFEADLAGLHGHRWEDVTAFLEGMGYRLTFLAKNDWAAEPG